MSAETSPTDLKSPLPGTGANTTNPAEHDISSTESYKTLMDLLKDNPKGNEHVMNFLKENCNDQITNVLGPKLPTSAATTTPATTTLQPQPSTTPTTSLFTNTGPTNPTISPFTNTGSTSPTTSPFTNTGPTNPTTSPFTNTGSTSPTTSPFTNTSSTSPTTSPFTNTGSTIPTTSLFTNTSSTIPSTTTTSAATTTPATTSQSWLSQFLKGRELPEHPESTSLFTAHGTIKDQSTNAPPAQPQNTPATNPPGPYPTPTEVPIIAPIIKTPPLTPAQEPKAPNPNFPTLKTPSLKDPDPLLTPKAPIVEDPSLKATTQTTQTPATQTDSEPHEIIHIYRHAEGLHNIQGGQIPDPYLTTLGLTQCAQIQKNTAEEVPDIIISSPLKRTIQTAIFCFASAIAQRRLRVHLVPELIETGDYPCNRMSDRVLLEGEFGEIIDTARVPEKATPVDGGLLAVTSRAINARQAIDEIIQKYREKNPEKNHINVMVVTHGAFIPHLIAIPPRSENMWGNTEHRSYRLTKGTRANQIKFTETQASKDQRGLGKHKNPKLDPANAELERQLREDYNRRKTAARESGSLLLEV
ncbi:hypothetical protein ABKA04_003315 [Annulohypoxylon sp. FPYF3050]